MDNRLILLDIEVQKDFFDPQGNCYSTENRAAFVQIRRLFRWARACHVPVMSTLLRVRGGWRGPLSPIPHCVDGTAGEHKMPGTILPSRINLGLRNTTDLPLYLFDRYQQVVFEKRDTDIFAHARAERLLTELEPRTFILCGAGVARGIAEAAVGLRTRGFPVVLASDAVADLDDPLAEMACLRMEAKGVVFIPTREIVAPRSVQRPAVFRSSVRTG